MSTPSRKVIFRRSMVDCVEYLLDQSTNRTIVLVCSTRERFLEQLYRCYDPSSLQQAAHNHGTYDGHESNYREPRGHPTSIKHHALIARTLGLLAKSSRIRVVFCPSVEHLRAFLATLHILYAKQKDATDPDGELQPRRRALLAVVDILACHHHTSELSAQGLSRSFASLVEAASRTDMDVVLCECDDGETRWDTNVPILSSSIRIGRDNDGPFSGRGVSLKRIAQRWFDFDETRLVETTEMADACSR